MPAAIMMSGTEKHYLGSHESHDSNTSESPPASNGSSTKKRSSSMANIDTNGNPKPVKRRAAKACAACRARKVRCDVMQRYHVTPDGEVTCSNCQMDGIRCVIEESKRRKKHINGEPTSTIPTTARPLPPMNPAQAWSNGLVNPTDMINVGPGPERRWSGSSTTSHDLENNNFSNDPHVPHSIYQTANTQISKGELHSRPNLMPSNFDPDLLINSASIHGDRVATRLDSPQAFVPTLKHQLPDYIRPLPQRMTSVDIDYLFAKGALSIPDTPMRNALVRAYLEFVHPYMPLIEVHDFLQIIEDGTGQCGRLSLLLFQAIMFAGTAFVGMKHLRKAGFANRKAARKAFFQKARVLYDFDYEMERLNLVQSLLLMTYWYETPDDQKDTWHWMGVAISLAHTIGLHRDPEQSNMEPNKKKLWKRIWWSCFMRDRLVALGMRRPTRVKDEDYDVPMLKEEDFEIRAVSDHITIVPRDCTVLRDTESQRRLAQMCIAKAKLCLCVSHVLTAQYSVLVKAQGMQDGNARSSVMLFPKKIDQTDEVKKCDEELRTWVEELPETCAYSTALDPVNSPVFVQRSLLHMVYFTTLSALHRPQVLPSVVSTNPEKCRDLQDISRKKVREASREITRISQDLHTRGLERYLPTTGVTVLLPAIIIHLLDIKGNNDEARLAAMEGFVQCMQVLQKLRDNYASADFATQFLEAAIRKADIDVMVMGNSIPPKHLTTEDVQATLKTTQVKELLEQSRAARRTPPPTAEDQLRRLPRDAMDIQSTIRRASEHAINAHTPPDSDAHTHVTSTTNDVCTPDAQTGLEMDFVMPTNPGGDFNMNDYLNFDGAADGVSWPLEQGAHGESGGFVGDLSWIDASVPTWSRLNSPMREMEGDKESRWGPGPEPEMFDPKTEVEAVA